ncbi:sodium- and chloride-dependent glycine transporter 1-like [Mytilus trossulus]|uniref:sodium- and chloride-dependent glycine transporter 1-like n=1 Tax=Mytilus trossulus TaxID=6551 RepID=UPI00300637FD
MDKEHKLSPGGSLDSGLGSELSSQVEKGVHFPSQNGTKNDSVEIGEPVKIMERGQWGGKLEFILTCVGYAVGLGNVWRFPYLAFKNGGGAFLIPYWFMQLFVGMPLFFMELSFGQFASLGPLAIWKVNPLFKGLGYCSVIVSAVIGLYYNVIIGYCFFFFFASMSDPLPWSQEVTSHNNTNSTVLIPSNFTNTTGTERSKSEEFFYDRVLNMSDGLHDFGAVRWELALCLLLAWVVVLAVLAKGIKSLGKVVYFTALFPYIILLALFIRGVTLDGASDGIYYYLTPQWDRLADSTVWSDAATQVFFSLSACSGGLILMASYNKFDNFCLRDALIVPIVDCLTSFFAGLVIFTVLGFMAHQKGVTIDEVARGGPGLAFIAYPEAISNMPAPTVWAVLFFFMMLIIGFSSEFSIMETVMASFIDEYAFTLRKNWRNSAIFRVTVCMSFYLLALPMTTRGGFYLFELVDNSISGFPLLFVGLFECIAINWIYGYKQFADDIEMMLGKRPCFYWRFCWSFFTPLVLFVVIVFKAYQYEPLTLEDYEYPDYGLALWWLICLFPILAIPTVFLFKYIPRRQLGVRTLMKPTLEWGPAFEENRRGTKYERIKNPIYGKTNLSYIHDEQSDSNYLNSKLSNEPPPTYQESTRM